MSAAVTTETPIYSSLGGDPDFAELVEMFVAEIPCRISALSAAAQCGDWTEVGRLAHQLKGAAGGYGYDEVTALASRVESAAREAADPARIQRAAAELANLCGRIRPGAPASA